MWFYIILIGIIVCFLIITAIINNNENKLKETDNKELPPLK